MSGARSRRLVAAIIAGAVVALVPLILRTTPAAADQMTFSSTNSEQTFTADRTGMPSGVAGDRGAVVAATLTVSPGDGFTSGGDGIAGGSASGQELAVTRLDVGGIALSAFLALIAGTALLLSVRHRRVAATAITGDQLRPSEILDQLLDEDEAE
jgi:hypothetical protein